MKCNSCLLKEEEAFDLTLSDNEDEKDDSEKLVCYCKETT